MMLTQWVLFVYVVKCLGSTSTLVLWRALTVSPRHRLILVLRSIDKASDVAHSHTILYQLHPRIGFRTALPRLLAVQTSSMALAVEHMRQVPAPAPPDLLCLCLSALSCAMNTPALFQCDSDSACPQQQEQQLLALTAKVALQQQPTPHEVAKLLIIWLGTRPSMLLPRHVQAELLRGYQRDAPVRNQISDIQNILSQVDQATAETLRPLALFLHQYVLNQERYDEELHAVCRVFAPLLFSITAEEPGLVQRSETITALLVSNAVHVLRPVDPWPHHSLTASEPAALPTLDSGRPSMCGALTEDKVMTISQQTASSPHEPATYAAGPLCEEVSCADPGLLEAMERMVSLTVGGALFYQDAQDAAQLGYDEGHSDEEQASDTENQPPPELQTEPSNREDGVVCVVVTPLDTPRSKGLHKAEAAAKELPAVQLSQLCLVNWE